MRGKNQQEAHCKIRGHISDRVTRRSLKLRPGRRDTHVFRVFQGFWVSPGSLSVSQRQQPEDVRSRSSHAREQVSVQCVFMSRPESSRSTSCCKTASTVSGHNRGVISLFVSSLTRPGWVHGTKEAGAGRPGTQRRSRTVLQENQVPVEQNWKDWKRDRNRTDWIQSHADITGFRILRCLIHTQVDGSNHLFTFVLHWSNLCDEDTQRKQIKLFLSEMTLVPWNSDLHWELDHPGNCLCLLFFKSEVFLMPASTWIFSVAGQDQPITSAAGGLQLPHVALKTKACRRLI